MPVRTRRPRRILRRPKRRLVRRKRVVARPGPSIRRHAFRVIVGSKDFGSAIGIATSLGSMSVTNAGMTTLATIALQTTFYYAFSMYFTLNTLPNYTTYTNAYDQYMIKSVTLKFYPVNNMVTAQDANNLANSQFGGFLHWIVDYDDAGIPTASDVGIDTLRRRPSYKMMNIHRSTCLRRSLRPHIAVGAYAGAFTSFKNDKSGWIDCNSPATQHYGIKGIFEMVNPSANISFQNFKCEATFDLVFKDPI